ncbi:MAG: aminoacyl-tRNA hydrolase [Oscillospiraceae bacterium]|jgi:PTH1 family peptidyl-tRNA hydrolase|nr:aminoacyl-tRNA hydrolase [Oscillospiraceae bacterium]
MTFFINKQGGVKFIVCGLGNPGAKYDGTRHNAGFSVIDLISQQHGFGLDRLKHRSLTAVTTFGGEKTLFMKPQTFMNLSGDAVREAMAFYKLSAEQTLLIFDDIELDVGGVRIRTKGGAGTHNGLRDIISKTGTEMFPRIRLGVGDRPNRDYDLADWVLSKFSKSEQEKFGKAADIAAKAAAMITGGGIEQAMNTFNGKTL